MLITKYEIYIYIKLTLDTIGKRQSRSSQILQNIMAKETENSKKESTSKKQIQYSKIELSALSLEKSLLITKNKWDITHCFFGG